MFSQYGFLKSLHWIRFEIESVQAVRGLNFIMLYTFYFITNLGQVEIRTEASPESINNAVITIGWTKRMKVIIIFVLLSVRVFKITTWIECKIQSVQAVRGLNFILS